jgi:hypothetical protein
VADDGALDVGVGVVLAGLMVAVVASGGGQLLGICRRHNGHEAELFFGAGITARSEKSLAGPDRVEVRDRHG